MEQKVNEAAFSGISDTTVFKGEGGVLRRWEREKRKWWRRQKLMSSTAGSLITWSIQQRITGRN